MILTDDLVTQIAQSAEAANWLILDKHPEFAGQWIVNCLDQAYFLDFADLIGPYRAVAPANLDSFMARANKLHYEVAFADDPADILSAYEHLNDEPEVHLNSEMPGTVNGLLPFQVQGFNFLKDLNAGVAVWSTGTGKSVLASALVKYYLEAGSTDYIWIICRSHNKINLQRTLSRLAEVDSLVLDGVKKRREEMLGGLIQPPTVPVVITNYEKFRVDIAHLLPLFEGTRVLIIWDEMPTKLKSRKTQLYKAVRKILYRKVNLSQQRPAELRQFMLSATPIENNPEDFFNCVRLLDPAVYGSISDFYKEFVEDWVFYQPIWHNLDRMGLKTSHIVHQVDKADPDIAAQFPEVVETPYYVEWHDDDWENYVDAQRILESQDFDPLSQIAVLRMLCAAPSMVAESAGRRSAFEAYVAPYDDQAVAQGSKAAEVLRSGLSRPLTNDTHTKLEILKMLVTEDHKNEKIVVFSSWNNLLLPIIEDKFLEWGVSHVRYDGTRQQKQTAQDYFTEEDWVQVFLSSDQGSDSISLEQASVVIHFDLPWKWSTYIQRQNRIHRVTSEHRSVRYYTLMMVDSVEERMLKILMQKQHYHDAVFKGEISKNAESSRMTKEDLLYILGKGRS